MIKKFEEFINEGIIMKTIKRSLGNGVRKENKSYSNVKELNPVDLGTDVLWADQDLEINGESMFKPSEMCNFTEDGWRLPTKSEINLLHKCTDIIKIDSNNIQVIGDNDNFILFNNEDEEVKGHIIRMSNLPSIVMNIDLYLRVVATMELTDDNTLIKIRLVKDK